MDPRCWLADECMFCDPWAAVGRAEAVCGPLTLRELAIVAEEESEFSRNDERVRSDNMGLKRLLAHFHGFAESEMRSAMAAHSDFLGGTKALQAAGDVSPLCLPPAALSYPTTPLSYESE